MGCALLIVNNDI